MSDDFSGNDVVVVLLGLTLVWAFGYLFIAWAGVL
jgi:hypothetical protein